MWSYFNIITYLTIALWLVGGGLSVLLQTTFVAVYWRILDVFYLDVSDNLCRYRDVPKDAETYKQCGLHYFRTNIYSITFQPYGIYSLVQQKTTTRRLRHNLGKRHFRISYGFVAWQT